MSYSHPKRSAYGSLRRSRSSSTLTGLNQARRSRNCFQRRPLRSSHSTQCLFPSTIGVDADAVEEIPPTGYASLTTSTYVRFDEVYDSDSEYSEYDLVNEQMQDFLLDSDDSLQGVNCADGVLGIGPYCVSGFVPTEPTEPTEALHSRLRRRTATPQRRRLAKKSESSAALSAAPRVTPSSSTTLLSDLDTNLRETVTMVGHTHLRNRKQRRAAAGDRRFLVPALAPLSGDNAYQTEVGLPLFTVVFDLDETLVGARNGLIQPRPHVGTLLRALHALPVEIIVWTAGTAHYVNPILHALGQACGRREWFHHIISRHKRWYSGANTSVKDLTQLGRPMDRVLMIENNPISVVQQPNLCILVEDYLRANSTDESLLVLQGVLERLVEAHRKAAPPSAVKRGVSASSLTYATLEPGGAYRTDESLSAPPLSALLAHDAALQTIEFRMDDVCNEDGVSMNQKVELRERVSGAETLLCRALRYSPSLPSALPLPQAQTSVSVRSYGCVRPMIPL
ncbi:hypothetical protein ABB37_03557 [Leptomonas pyrrhocoris]|uniref:Mitochondrial import inner membrane translocase subunit TIM50 n=1 Tax=Leptomonas pyrrhocoris TaxID=157538 RepID=A0A0N0DX28_LEPPY|nr:hypothetical protein ABB37_03557 [Leptomonas pyrrhocoris]KPA82505.1 hypothetical protein ABB37_03557 [Leptomonas pyrrhocoris]|eukprot:XP_015660944.1 hypothetical protein ABB37_03557 [Leptomonas pyrrhocoris]